jgi:hypothetical protein
VQDSERQTGKHIARWQTEWSPGLNRAVLK